MILINERYKLILAVLGVKIKYFKHVKGNLTKDE